MKQTKVPTSRSSCGSGEKGIENVENEVAEILNWVSRADITEKVMFV